ncbi:MAG: cob(I)yrinic acid a,c-diamide adenosyltransferase [Planctomycetota bacterium]|jgi:cob(I)alamin adenosyltransferase
MKLYTRSGDDGTTGLFGEQRVGKDHPRVEAYGTVDELNGCLGLAAAAVGGDTAEQRQLREMLEVMQSRLFDLGADLATPDESKHAGRIHRVDAAHVREVEAWIDQVEAGNAPLEHFVLPGGTDLAARLHLARCVCRRAERRVVNLARGADVNRQALIFLNRVGDLLFALARQANRLAAVADVPWVPGTGPEEG